MRRYGGFDKVQSADAILHSREFPVVILFTPDSPGHAQVNIGHGIEYPLGMPGR